MKRAWTLPDGHRVTQEGPEWSLYRKGRSAPIYIGDAEGLVDFIDRHKIARIDLVNERRKEIRRGDIPG